MTRCPVVQVQTQYLHLSSGFLMFRDFAGMIVHRAAASSLGQVGSRVRMDELWWKWRKWIVTAWLQFCQLTNRDIATVKNPTFHTTGSVVKSRTWQGRPRGMPPPHSHRQHSRAFLDQPWPAPRVPHHPRWRLLEERRETQ